MDANSLNQLYNNAESSHFGENYPITEESQNHDIYNEQPVYTQLKNVSYKSYVNNLQNKSDTSNNNNSEMSDMNLMKVQVSWGTAGTNDDDL